MADMGVRMTLTLADAASGPLRAFIGQMEQLRAMATGSLRPLEGVATVIANINRIAASSGLRTLTGEVAGLGAAAGATRANTVGLEASMAALTATVTGLGARLTANIAGLTATAAGLAGVGAAANAAGAGVNAGAAQMGAGLAAANAHAGTLMQTLRAVAQLYAAAKIKDGLTASAEGAIKYESSQNRAANMGLTPSEIETLRRSARATIAAVPQFDRNQALDMALDLKNAMNSVAGAAAIMPEMAKLSVNLNAAGLKSDKDVFVNVGKFLQQRNAVSDPDKMRSEMDMIGKIVAYTQGRVDVSKIVQSVQAMRATGDNVSAEFLPVLASMIEMSGGQNVQGAGLYAAERYVMGNVKNGTAAKEAAKLGLLDPSKLQWNSQGNIDLKKSELRMAGAELWQQNPYEWVKQYLLPSLQKAGITDTDGTNRSINRMFPTARAGDAISTMATKTRIFEGDIAGTGKTLGQQEQFDNNMKTAAQRIEAVKGQFRDLGIVLGETFLPTIKKVADALVAAFKGASDFFEQHPIIANFVMWGAAIAGVVLGLSGMAGLFGVALRPLAVLWGPITTAVAAFGGAMSTMWAFVGPTLTTLGTAAMTAARVVGGAFLRMVPLVGALVVGWEFGSLLSKLNVFGKDVDEWGAILIEKIVNAFAWGWRKIGEIITSIIPGANAAEAAGRAGPRRGSLDRSGLAGLREDAPTARTLPDTGMGGGRGSVNPALVVPVKSPVGLAFASILGAPPDEGGGGKSGSRAALRERFSTSAITDPQQQYKADFLRSEKSAYDIKAAPGPTAAELDKLELQVKRDLLMTAGQRKAAEAARLQAELEGDLKILVATGRITQAEADLARARAQANVDLKNQQTDTAVMQEEYRRKLLAIDAAERNGTITETQATQQRMALHKQEAAILNDLLAKELALAEARGDVEGAAKIKTAMATNDATLGQLDPNVTTVLKTAQQGFTTFFQGLLNGTKSVRQSFLDLGNSIFQSINNIIAKKLGDALFESLFGDLAKGLGGAGGTFGSGGGGIFQSLGNLISGAGSKFFGGLGSSLFGASGEAAIGNMGAAFVVPGFASGTDYVPRDMLAMIHEGERITPKAYNPAAGGRVGGSQMVSQSFHFAGPVDRRTAMQVGADAQRGLLAARRNL